MAHIFKSFDKSAGRSLGTQTVEEVATEVLVGRTLQHMVRNHEDRVPNRHHGTFTAATSG